MAGGQSITSAQGSVTQSESVALTGQAITSDTGYLRGIALTGAGATASAGTSAPGTVIGLRSRKVGGGAASRALVGQSLTASQGVPVSGSVPAMTTLLVTGSQGAFTKTRSIVPNGAAVTIGNGSMVVLGSSTAITTFSLVSATTQTLAPFTIGMALKRGEVPSGTGITTSLANYQSVITRTWNDGSAKHVVISGRSNTSTTATSVTVSTGTAPTGTNLTSASITAAAPTASVQCGAFGTVSLSSLLASPVRTWYTGPQMVECHYRGDVGGGTLLSVWFHVRLYAGGKMWIRAVVENGYRDNGSGGLASNANRVYVPTITIGGTVVYNNGGVSATHYANVRYMAEGWIGGDPAVTATHNAAYLRSTKLVPNYGWTNPSAATLNALTQTYTPFSNGGWSTDMSSTGYQPGIGVLPAWDALYCTSGDARALRNCLINSSHLNSYAIGWRAASQAIVTPTAFPALSWATLNSSSAGSLFWEEAHHGSGGYLAYILTGDAWHYETMALQASMCYLSESDAGLGVNRIIGKQIRGNAWAFRTMGQYCAVARTDSTYTDPALTDYRALMENNYAYYASVAQSSAPYVWSGLVYAEDWSWAAGEQGTWMHDFWTATNGSLSDSDALASQTSLNIVRDTMYKLSVGRFGREGVPAEYPFISGARYTHKFAVSNFPAPITANYYQTWGEIYTATTTLVNNQAPTNSLGSDGQASILSEAPTSYWGQAITALAYAVDHAATGASAAYSRLIGATNWSTIRDSGFDNTPLWGVVPRVSLATPSHIASATVGQWTAIGTNTIESVKYGGPYDYGNSNLQGIFNAWSGGDYDLANHQLVVHGGGHTDYGGNEIYAFNLQTNVWSRLCDPSHFADNGGASPPTGGMYPDGRPQPVHTYGSVRFNQATGKFYRLLQGGSPSSTIKEWTRSTNTWAVKASVAGASTGGSSAWDSVGGKFYINCSQSDFANLYSYDPSTDVVARLADSGTAPRNGTSLLVDTSRRTVVMIGGSRVDAGPTAAAVCVYNILTNTWTNQATTGPQVMVTSGAYVGSTMVYDPIRRVYWGWPGSGTTLYRLDPTTWVWTAITPSGGATPTPDYSANTNGIYGRFQYCADYDVFICAAQTTASVYLYKPTDWSAP